MISGGDRMYKILIVDDEEILLQMLKYQFEGANYEVLTAINSDEALKRLRKMPDIILLDINMPEINGLQLCTMIREYISVPIIFLTARADEGDKVKGLLVGGDDYITKPFNMEELFARVAAHLRREERCQNRTQILFEKKGLVFDYENRKAYINHNQVEFSNKEFEILHLLSTNSGQVFDRDRIYEIIWGIDGCGDSNVVKEHIRKIRTKLLEYTDEVYIETVWGVGYRWKK